MRRKQRQFETEALIHLDTLYAVSLRLTAGDVPRAEDLVQETFLNAYRAWHSFEPGSNCRAWMMRILRNLFLDDCRKRSRFVGDMEPEALLSLLSVNPFRENGAEARLVEGPLGIEVRRAIDRLPLVYRETLVLSDLMDLTYIEIAEETGVPVGTVKSRLFRARRMVQAELGDYAVSMGILQENGARAAAPSSIRPPTAAVARLESRSQAVH